MNKFRIFIIATLFSSQLLAQDGQKIDQLAQLVVKTMKGFDTTNIQTLRLSLITESEIQDFVNALHVPEDEREELRERLEGDFFKEQVDRMFNRLVRESREIGIVWQNIEFEDFLYKLRMRDGIKELKGDIYFRDGDNYYEMRVHSAMLNGKFVILELEDVDVSYELHGYPEGYDPYDEMQVIEFEEGEYTDEEPVAVPDVEIIEAEPIPAPTIEEEIVDFPEVEPEFPGGVVELQKFIRDNVNYPQEALEEDIQGKIYISFVVEKDGRLTNVKVERSVHPSLDEEAKRLIYLMPRWTPGQLNGKKVRTRTRLPITFKLP